jgi:LysR family transcriptional regulator, transcriptional activator of nhaA
VRVDWLNYHHLLYFRTVAREGGVAQAAAKLHLTHPTVSAQVKELEAALGEKLLERRGRSLVLTEMGRVVYRYADEIFGLGSELMETVRGRPSGRPLRLVVGVADVVPKAVACRLLEPALRLAEPVRLVCREDKAERLAADLARHDLDVVLTDAPLSPLVGVKAFSHLLGECGVTFFAPPASAARLRRRFPASLDGEPFLMPTEGTALRRSLDQWFEDAGVRPAVAIECEDSALLKAFAQRGAGAFAAPSAIADEVARQFGVRKVGSTDDIRERFYAVTVERRIRHPAVAAISQAAREEFLA